MSEPIVSKDEIRRRAKQAKCESECKYPDDSDARKFWMSEFVWYRSFKHEEMKTEEVAG